MVFYRNCALLRELMLDFMFYIDSAYHYTKFGNDQGLLRALVMKYSVFYKLLFVMHDAPNWNPTWHRADRLRLQTQIPYKAHYGYEGWINEANGQQQYIWHGAGGEKLWTRKYDSPSVNEAWEWIGGTYDGAPDARELGDHPTTTSAFAECPAAWT